MRRARSPSAEVSLALRLARAVRRSADADVPRPVIETEDAGRITARRAPAP